MTDVVVRSQEDDYGLADYEAFCSWAARRNLELGGSVDGVAAGFQLEEERGWDAGASGGSADGLNLSGISAGEESAWGGVERTASGGGSPKQAEALAAALAAAEMSAPAAAWSDM